MLLFDTSAHQTKQENMLMSSVICDHYFL